MSSAANTPPKTERAALTAVRFVRVSEALADARVVATFADPWPAVATASELPLETLEAPAQDAAADEFQVLCLPQGGRAAGGAWTERVSTWLDAAPGAAGPVLSWELEQGEIRWRGARAVVRGPASLMEPALAALATLAFYELQLQQVERGIAGDWDAVHKFVPLMAQATKADLAHAASLAGLTQRTMDRRLCLSRIEPHLLAAAPGAAPPALRKAIAALRRKARVEARMEIVDGQLETYEYILETANQRLSEYANHRSEIIAEAIIIGLLLLEAVAMGYEIWLTWYLSG